MIINEFAVTTAFDLEVHCRTITRGVHTNIVSCSGCGRSLFVRDHFSRRLGAYMGFQIDAEVPGEVPAAEVVYP